MNLIAKNSIFGPLLFAQRRLFQEKAAAAAAAKKEGRHCWRDQR